MFVELIITLLFVWILYLIKLQQKPRNYPPGPWGLPLIGNLHQLGSSPHEGVSKLGEKYGKIFSLHFGSFPVVILNDPEVIRKALKTDGFDGRPQLPLMGLEPNGIAFNPHESWKEQRRFVVHKLRDYGFGKQNMDGIIAGEVKELVQHLQNLKGKSIFPRHIYGTSVLNNLWTIVAGTKYSLEDLKVLEMQRLGAMAFMDPPVAGILYFLPLFTKWFPKWTGFSECMEHADKFRSMCWDVVTKNAETYSPEQERYFLDAYWKKMQETTDENSSFYKLSGEKNLRGTLAGLFVPGFDTLSSTLTWATLYLALHEDKMEKLADEISSVLGHDHLICSEDLKRMPYTEATMAEVMRISSIVPHAIPHSITRDVEFEGYTLPKGTIVIPNLYESHTDRKIWGDPENFRPERFLNDQGKFVKHDALMPFSIGKRICPAEGMATIQFFIYLTGLVQAFRFKIDKNMHAAPPTTKPLPGLVMQAVPFHVSFVPRC